MVSRNILIVIFALLIVPRLVSAQSETERSSKKDQKKERPAYIGVSAGSSIIRFADFATSPLIYTGVGSYSSLSRIRSDQKRESEKGFSYLNGICMTMFNDQITQSTVRNLSLYYSELYQIKRLSSEQYNVKVGGMFNTSANIRINEKLLNNILGLEVIPTLFGSMKVTTDISRKQDVQKRFLFFKYTLKQRPRKLSYRLNVGIINSSYRNGYVYADQSAITNDYKLFADYQFNFLSGFSMGSALDYTFSLKNKNLVQLSYLWDAYKTGGDFETFEMAQHIFKVTLLFNTNNK